MRLAYPSGRYDLLFQAPTGTTPTVYRALWTYQAPTAAPTMPDWAPNAQLSMHWQVGSLWGFFLNTPRLPAV